MTQPQQLRHKRPLLVLNRLLLGCISCTQGQGWGQRRKNMLLSQQPPAGTRSCPHSQCVHHSVNSRPTVFPEFPSLFMPSFSLSICRMLRSLHIRGPLILDTSLQCIHFFIQSRPQMCMLMSAVPRVLEKLIEPLTPLQEMRC